MVAFALVPLLVACTGGDTDPTETGDTDDTDGGGGGAFEQFINVTTPAVGDLSCYTAGSAWLTQTPDATLQTTESASGTVQDFESEEGVSEAYVDIWTADAVSGAPDISGTSDTEGNISLDVPVCQPYTYKVWTDASRGETVDTYEAHQIDAPSDLSGVIYNSVSTTTYSIIPGLLGVTVDPDKGVIAGAAYDCNNDAIDNAQVVVVDADGNIPSSLQVNYFKDSFPNRSEPDTSEDGLWVAMNVPEGDWFVEMWAVAGSGEPVLLGRTSLKVLQNSINIGNIYAGYGDGVKYPDECLAQ